MANPQIRKQVYELTAADLDAFPVWTFALDEEGVESEDEATVRPYVVRGSLDPDEAMFVVRAKFRLADGRPARGYLTPSTDARDLGTSQPVIVTPTGQVGFWLGMIEPAPSEIVESYARLERAGHGDVFPVQFESDIP
jgi:hypothetical protein